MNHFLNMLTWADSLTGFCTLIQYQESLRQLNNFLVGMIKNGCSPFNFGTLKSASSQECIGKLS